VPTPAIPLVPLVSPFPPPISGARQREKPIVPKLAQDRLQRGPLAAFVILLGLLLGGGPGAATAAGVASPAARTAFARHRPSAALLQPKLRTTLDDDASGAGPLVLPTGRAIVSGRVWVRPAVGFPARTSVPRPQPGAFLYRARAPPAA
jgi:hypothetical protein